MIVNAVEELGAQRLVHGHVEGEPLSITLPSDYAMTDKLRLSVAPGAVHLFNAETGKRLN